MYAGEIGTYIFFMFFETLRTMYRIIAILAKKEAEFMPSNDERVMSMLIYVSSFFTVFIGPLIIWLLKKDSSKYVDYYGREYFNFLISYVIYGVVAGVSIFLLVGFILLPIVCIAQIVFTIIAAVKAYEGTEYRIPFILRIL